MTRVSGSWPMRRPWSVSSPGGVGVVGRDRRLDHVLDVVRADRLQQAGLLQRLADPAAQLAAALVVKVSPRTSSGGPDRWPPGRRPGRPSAWSCRSRRRRSRRPARAARRSRPTAASLGRSRLHHPLQLLGRRDLDRGGRSLGHHRPGALGRADRGERAAVAVCPPITAGNVSRASGAAASIELLDQRAARVRRALGGLLLDDGLGLPSSSRAGQLGAARDRQGQLVDRPWSTASW
jgi:hypothetical protein